MKSRPVRPVAKASGAKTEASVRVIATIANPISRAPRIAASRRGIPSSMCRKMFSNMTIASSTTSPIASTIDSSVSVLIVKPSTYIRANAPISETGIVTIGINVARRLRRKKKITRTTSRIASPIERNTLKIERSMNTDVSYATTSFMPGGMASFILTTSARTAVERSSGFATACLITPMFSDGLPLNREMTRSSTGPISALPMSRMRTG